MSLYSSMNIASNSLRANEIALQVVAQNIANANTPGYIREEVQFAPAPTQRIGNLLLGMGVRVDAVVQKIDLFLESRLRNAVSDQGSAETIEQNYAQLESIIGELGDTDLSTSMNNFFASISEILNQPESASVRNLAVLQGETLTADINRMATRVVEVRGDLNERVVSMADDINRLTNEISVLNVRIAEAEGGNISNSDAVGLRDQRLVALENLAKIIDIKATEQLSGGVAVYSGGDYLVFEGTVREVNVVSSTDRGLAVAEIKITETNASLDPSSGRLQGLVYARDEVFGDYLDKLNDLAGTLAYEFNKVYASGQGLKGFEELTSTFNVDTTDDPLDQTGLDFTPVNGSFQVLVYNKKTGLTQTSQIIVDLNGMGDDMTLEDLTADLNAIDGVSAEITSNRSLKISSTGANQEIGFADDTSGVLAALGLNTFFTGSNALNIGINSDVKSDPLRFAASKGGIGADTDTAIELVNFIDRPLSTKDGSTLAFLYDRMVSDATQGSTVAKAVAEGIRVFEVSLRGQKTAMSGVNLDEEAIHMLAYQRSFQASARLIVTINELFAILVSI